VALYIDVSNDTVVPTKPKVEILPFAQAQLIPIADYWHYSKIAANYWQGNIYPNYILPELAPYCPLIHVRQTGEIRVVDPSQYMMAMNHAKRFQPSEAVLRDALMPNDIFQYIVDALRGERCTIANSPEHGRQLALQHSHTYRAKRFYQSPPADQQSGSSCTEG
jgi:hypothetical protein